MGQTKDIPYVPDSARRRIAISAGLQLTVYVAAVASILMGQMAAWYYWFLPALLAQPFLRMITLAEHTGCTLGDDGLTNTRTTLTTLPIRLFMWNMPFHTEHHLYPSIPFHLLPQAHQELKSRRMQYPLSRMRVTRCKLLPRMVEKAIVVVVVVDAEVIEI